MSSTVDSMVNQTLIFKSLYSSVGNRQFEQRNNQGGLPWLSSGYNSMLPMYRAQVQSLFGKQRSCLLCCMVENTHTHTHTHTHRIKERWKSDKCSVEDLKNTDVMESDWILILDEVFRQVSVRLT